MSGTCVVPESGLPSTSQCLSHYHNMLLNVQPMAAWQHGWVRDSSSYPVRAILSVHPPSCRPRYGRIVLLNLILRCVLIDLPNLLTFLLFNW